MTTPSRKRWPRRSLLASLSAALGAAPAAAQHLRLAAAPAAVATAVPGEIELFLDVTLNGVRTGKLAGFIVRDGAWWADPASLRNLGLRWPGSDTADAPVALRSLAGLTLTYDEAGQRIALLAPVGMLDRPGQLLVPADQASITPDAALPSLVVSYDIYGQQTRGQFEGSSLGAWSEVRLSGVGPGIWDSTAVGRVMSLPGATSRETVRLDTRWQYDLPSTMVSLSAGDTVTGALSWSRSTRIGGLRLARNFGLQPYLTTAPAALVRGEAVLPSTVDLYINGLRQVSRPVQPGVFTVEGSPMLNGAGQARLVITDINGQQRVVDFPLYGTPQLLRAGLLDGSVELGAVREAYGVRSLDYGRLAASATGRYGMTDGLTLEGHGEADSRVVMAGAGATWLLPAGAGAIAIAGAASQAAGRAGRQASLGYQWSRDGWNLATGSLRRNAAFRDVGSGYGAELPFATDQVFGGMSSRWGSFGAGYVRQAYAAAEPARLANLSWTADLPGTSSLTLSVLRDLQARTTSITLSFNVPLDSRLTLATGARSAGGRLQATAGARSSTPGDLPGWGWRAEGALGEQRSALGEVSRLGDHGRWSAGLLYQDASGPASASTTVYGAASGALLWAGGAGFALPRVDEAFALVTTDGVAGVPVQVESRQAGVTGDDGRLLVRGLRPYERNRLSINPLKLEPDMRLDAVQEEVVPPGRAGVVARFALRRVVAVQFMLHDAWGTPLPAGSRAMLEAPGAAPQPLVVGYDGMVYLEDPPADARLRVEAGDAICTAALPPLAQARGIVDGGILACRQPAAG
ncbi:MAG: fimbrial biogenesis outer membrane usher protein, partial [Comamonadaceae bacterium]